MTRSVRTADQGRLCLSDRNVIALASLGRRIEHILGGRHYIEWAIADDHIWILHG